MGPRFFGRFEHSLDPKGRVILPARLRTSFETRAYLATHDEGCLALWTPEEFETKFAEMEANQNRSRDDRNLARVWAAGLVEIELDRQGRVAIPGYLRKYAGLTGAVLVLGALNRVELWDPGVWADRVGPAESRMSHGSPEPVSETAASSASPAGQD